MKKLMLLLCCLGTFLGRADESTATPPPVRVAMIGLVHDHAHSFIPGALSSKEIQLVGIVEPDQQLVARYALRYKLATNLFFPSLDALLAVTNVQAVATFTSTFEHRRVVEQCAPKGIHVMMEKPLAVSMEHALAMQAAAKKGHINLIVNYQTSWFPGNLEAYKLVCDQKEIGDIRKMVVHDGHSGPKEIGCSQDFLAWLTDPVLNGGGALMDFGCYGADLMTWLMQGQRPTSVFAVTQRIKPDVYPKVEDEATIVVTYPKAQGIIQASWNWPYSRKDMEIYGQTGWVLVPDENSAHLFKSKSPNKEVPVTVEKPVGPQSDPISYLAAVVRGELQPTGLSSLSVNMIATEILDAARESASTGKRIDLPATPPWPQ